MTKQPEMDDRISVFKLSRKEREQLRELGEFLSERGVYGLKTPKRGVNISAVIRYLVDRETRHMKKLKAKEASEGDKTNEKPD
jgi:hypothetical protein